MTQPSEKEIHVLSWPDCADKCGPPNEYRIVSKGVGFDESAHCGRWDAYVELDVESGTWAARYWMPGELGKASSWEIVVEGVSMHEALDAALNATRLNLAGY